MVQFQTGRACPAQLLGSASSAGPAGDRCDEAPNAGSFRLCMRRQAQEALPGRRHHLPFASVTSAASLGKPSAAGAGARTEPQTGYDFPLEFCYLRKAKCPSLTGIG